MPANQASSLAPPISPDTSSREAPYIIDGKEHHRGSNIGNGTYSIVDEFFSRTRSPEGQQVIKRLIIPSETEVLENDAKFSAKYLGPTVILKATDNDGLVGVVQPCISGKELGDYPFSSIHEFLDVCALGFEELDKMHNNGDVHGDPSKRNFKVEENNGKITVKVYDFGFTRKEGEETIGRRASYQPAELKDPAIARFYQDNITFLTVVREMYYELCKKKLFKDYGVKKLFDTILQRAFNECPPAAQLGNQFKQLAAINYFIIHHERLEFAMFTDKKRYGQFSAAIANFSPQLNDVMSDLFVENKLENIAFMISVISKEQCHERIKEWVIDKIKVIIKNNPWKLLETLQLLPHDKAKELFVQLKLSNDLLGRFSQVIFQEARSNFDVAFALIDRYCKRDMALYKKMVLIFNQHVYQDYIREKISKLSCVSALFYQSGYEKKLNNSRNLCQLSEKPAELKGKLQQMAVRVSAATHRLKQR